MARKQLLTYLDATEIESQHKKPCSDCPFSRKAIPGWLAGESCAKWMNIAHGDGRMECHTKLINGKAAECAGAAIFRANICKRVEDGNLSLPKNKESVFAWDNEFFSHHEQREVTNEEAGVLRRKELFGI